MKLTCLVDNTVKSSSPYWGEHGLSFLIESENRRVLFDTGASGTVLLHNLSMADTSPRRISALVLSHGHLDHTGGLAALLEQRPGLAVHAHPDVLRERFSRRDTEVRSVGLPMERALLRQRADLHLCGDSREIMSGVWTTGEITLRPEPEGRAKAHYVREGESYVSDPYKDDMALVLRGTEGLALLCGCCHAGLLNTLEHVQRAFGEYPRMILGGTHLIAADAQQIQHVIERLRQMGPPALYLNHCTGQAAQISLAVALGDLVSPCPAGSVLEL